MTTPSHPEPLQPNPSLRELPPPPEGKRGWPWDEAPPVLPGTMPDGRPWPRVTVVTPSFNQGRFLEETIRSVLLQGYPELEYIVIDGASTDDSVAVIRRYSPWLAHWESEPDRGQSHAINKGFTRATGEILCWLNSDDSLVPGALRVVAETLSSGAAALAGHCWKVHADGQPDLLLRGSYQGPDRLLAFWKGYQMHQPAIFWTRRVFERTGLLDERLHYTMDFDYWVRISKNFDFVNVDRPLARALYHPAAKTGDNYARAHAEMRRNRRHYQGSPFALRYWRFELSFLRARGLRGVKALWRRTRAILPTGRR